MKKPTSRVEVIQIRSFANFSQYISKHNTEDLVLFRGQFNDLELLPKIARIKPDRPVLEAEQVILRTFKEQSVPFLLRPPSSEWDWLAIAQHHRLPTRLLDWTTNPLVALWFTVSRPATKQKHGVVWVFKPSEADFVDASDDPFQGTRTKVFRPAHIADRIRVQSGYFTVHKYIKGRFVAFERNRLYKAKLVKLQIDAKAFSGLRFALDQYGINESVLFPDLDGLSKHIEWLHTYLEDETTQLRRGKKGRAWEIARTSVLLKRPRKKK